jgi:hypothetical protein
MARVYFAKGSRGDLIRNLQKGLTAGGFDTKGTDGIYGGDTQAAVESFQKANQLDSAGGVDDATWVKATGTAIPGIRDRSLQLTSTFESHGFTLAQGNFDGAGITWGIIGFTLKHGELSKIVLDVFTRHPELVEQAFSDNTDVLLQKMQATLAEQLAWADSISLGTSKAKLAEPWLSSFRRFGEMPEVQAVQLAMADKDYFQPALVTAGQFALTTELGLALAFDIHVQDGGIKQSARDQIAEEREEHSINNERDLRIIIANAVADNASDAFREDVRSRKLTIATGAGSVHGLTFLLRNWGLDEFAFQPSTVARATGGSQH